MSKTDKSFLCSKKAKDPLEKCFEGDYICVVFPEVTQGLNKCRSAQGERADPQNQDP